MKSPWMKFYPADWRADPRLRSCSLAARGLWVDMITYMHEGEPYGHLTLDGKAPDVKGIASLVARPVPEVKKALAELETRNVFSRSAAGAIVSRRMVRDQAKAEKDQKNGKGGGNPNLRSGVNPKSPSRGLTPKPPPEDKAQKLDAEKESGRDTRERASEPLISDAAYRLAADCMKAIGFDSCDPPDGWYGLEYQTQVMVARGYDHARTVAAFARTGPDKPMTYHIKVAESDHIEAGKPERRNGTATRKSSREPNPITAALERQREHFESEDGDGDALREAPPRLLSNG